jgi:hypothetical protein
MTSEGSQERRRGLAAVVALLLVVAAQTAMFLAAATRGLDLTDESFYLLTFQHWTEWPSVSLFGAYFSLPYALLGQSVWAIRVLGFILLLAAGIWFSREVCRSFDALALKVTPDGIFAASLAGGASIWNYYGAFIVPYTPSYNLLTLACALGTMALAMRVGRTVFQSGGRTLDVDSFALGLVASIGIASKFSAGVLVLGLSALIIAALAWRRLAAHTGARIALLATAGVAANLVALWLTDPELPTRFQRGIAVTWAMFPRRPANELVRFLFVEVPEALAVSLRILMWPLVIAFAAFVAGARLAPRRTLFDSIAVAAFVAGAMWVTYVKDNRFHRIALLTLVAVALALARWSLARRQAANSSPGRSLWPAAALLALPFACSFGTSNPLLRHMGMAAAFPAVLATSQLRSMWIERSISRWAFTLSLVLLAALPAEIVVRQWTSGEYTYRLGASLAEQTAPIPANPAGIEVSVQPSVARGLGDFLRLARDSGFVAGQPMIDFTGQSPGLVAVSGGVPLGAIWFVGGPLFDGDGMARLSLRYADEKDVRRAWLLTSADSFARIGSWASILEGRTGSFAYGQAGHVTVPDPTSDDKTKTIEVTLWRPTP